MASTRPAWASEMTSWTPDRPRAIRERRKASQPAPSSAVATSMPRISRWPSALTPTAISAWTLMIRPPSRTFCVRASTQTNEYGPASRGRLRKAATYSSRCLAIALTWDFDSWVTPRDSASFSTLRVETPSR